MNELGQQVGQALRLLDARLGRREIFSKAMRAKISVEIRVEIIDKIRVEKQRKFIGDDSF